MRFLCLSQSPRLYGTSISEKTRPKSSQSIDLLRLANDRRKHVNLLEGLIDTCSTKATFSPLSDRFHSSKEATYNFNFDQFLD